jgi:hypothetical protein
MVTVSLEICAYVPLIQSYNTHGFGRVKPQRKSELMVLSEYSGARAGWQFTQALQIDLGIRENP